jgi:hypothetical protein
MSYSGNVTVGGPADTRELPGLSITKVAVGPMDQQCLSAALHADR